MSDDAWLTQFVLIAAGSAVVAILVICTTIILRKD